MEPVVTPSEMNQIDAAALSEGTPLEELIERAGWAVYRAAAELLGTTYGRRVLILVGKGNNGADGRSAARFLERRGVRCEAVEVFAPGFDPATLNPARFDLIIDACVGTGLGRPFTALDGFDPGPVPVLAVDIPSGVDGATGAVTGAPLAATTTVTFAALKPGLLFEPGASLAGRVTVADIGLGGLIGETSTEGPIGTTHRVGVGDVIEGWPRRAVDAHKWRHSVMVIGGSPGMSGAASLVALGAMRAGASAVAISVPGLDTSARAIPPVEAIQVDSGPDWGTGLDLDRHRAVVVGPGLSVDAANRSALADFVARMGSPGQGRVCVFDAGALRMLAPALPLSPVGSDGGHRLHILTPHDGEFESLFGRRPGRDRIEATRQAARAAGAVVLLKGPTTVVAHPDGRVLVSTTGDQRLGTAGSGDVLAGIISAAVAGGTAALEAAALGAELHGQASLRSPSLGFTATDLPANIGRVLGADPGQAPQLDSMSSI